MPFARLGRRLIVIPPTAGPEPLVIQAINVQSSFREGVAFTGWAVFATGGKPPYLFTVIDGALPSAMPLGPDGSVPASILPRGAGGTYNATIQVADALGATATADVVVQVDYAQLLITFGGAIPTAAVGRAYAGIPNSITVAGGNGGYTLVKRTGTQLPAGLSLTAVAGTTDRWQITGTCTGVSGQAYTAILDATSADGQTMPLTFVIEVQAVAPVGLSVNFPTLPNFVVGTAYPSLPWDISGGTPPYESYRVGALPAGLTTAVTDVFSGTPTEGAGKQYKGTFGIADSSDPPLSVGVRYTLVGDPVVTPAVSLTMPTFTAATVGSAYSKAATAGSGTPPYGWVLSGPLPPGVTGVVSGANQETFTFTATSVGVQGAGQVYSGTLRASDAAGSVTKNWSITVDSVSANFVPPAQTAALPDKTFSADTSATQTYDTADYINPHDATDLAVGIQAVGTLPAGVSLAVLDDSATGQFRLGFDSPQWADQPGAVDIDYRLTMTYTDPTGTPPPTDAEADWIARSTGPGVVQAFDFREYASTAALRAATGSPNTNTPGQYQVNLSTADGIAGSKCLEILTFDGAGQQGGSWSFSFPTRLTEFYLQFSIWMDEEALTWANLLNDPGGLSKKILNIESYNSDRQVALAHRHYYGFLTCFLNGNQSLDRYLSGSATGANDDYFYQPAIDSGAATIPGDNWSFMRRYGPGYRLQRSLRDYGYKAAGSGIDNHVNQRGFPWPEPDALLSGAVPFVVNGWTTIEAHIKNSTDDAQDIVELFVAPHGSAPKKTHSNFPGGAGTVSNNHLGNTGDLAYQNIELLNYPTGRQPEPGYRPTQIQRYDQFIVSTAWIPFPGHLAGTAP